MRKYNVEYMDLNKADGIEYFVQIIADRQMDYRDVQEYIWKNITNNMSIMSIAEA